MENMPEIYKMKLHETRLEEGYYITRVPGGWIYSGQNENAPTGVEPAGVFVLFDNYFMDKEV